MGKPSDLVSKAAGVVKQVASELRGEHGIFAVLKREHQEVATLLNEIEILPNSAGNKRKELLHQVRIELESHDRAEEDTFYSRLRQDPDLGLLISGRDQQHRHVEGIAVELEGLDASTDDWIDTFRTFRRAVENHVQSEEHQIFPMAQAAIPEDEAKMLGEQFKEYKRSEKEALS